MVRKLGPSGLNAQCSIDNVPYGGRWHNGSMDSTPTGCLRLPVALASKRRRLTETELENARQREAWLKAALALAVKKGFVRPEQLPSADSEALNAPDDLKLEDLDTGADGTDKDRIVRALITLKTKLAAAQSTIAEQAQRENERIAESERSRSAALKETTFYRAKLHALETNNLTEASRLEHERAMALESRVAEALREKSHFERQATSLREQAKLEQKLRSSAEERLSETAKRAMSAAAAQMKAYEEVSALQKRSYVAEGSLREHADRAAEHERLHYQHRDLAAQHQQSVSQLQLELQQKNAELASQSLRITEMDTLINTLQREAETHKHASRNGLAEMMNTRALITARNAEPTVPNHLLEKMRALEEESEQLRQMHISTRTAADQAATTLAETREHNSMLEKQHSGLRSELSVVRSQLAIALSELARLKDQTGAKEQQLRDTSRAAEAAEVKANLIRTFMAEKGFSIPGDTELGSADSINERRIQTLQSEVDQKTKLVEELQQKVAHAHTEIGTLNRSAGSAVDSTQLADAERRADSAERELADTTASYKERMAQLESDYQTAVQFVKGTEKMLRRMKDELTKYKTENAQLQASVASLRSGTATEDGSEAARDIEALRSRLHDVTQQNEDVAAENRELERKMAALISEQKDAHDRSRGLADSHADSTKKAQVLEGEVQRLESSLSSVREELQKTLTLNQHLSSELAKTDSTGQAGASLGAAQAASDQLKHENQSLSQRLQETEDKLSLLLGRMESDASNRDSLPYQGSITSELDKFEQGLYASGGKQT